MSGGEEWTPVTPRRLTAQLRTTFRRGPGGKDTKLGRLVESPTYTTATKQASPSLHIQPTSLARRSNTIYRRLAYTYHPTKHQGLPPFILPWAALAIELSLATLSPTTKRTHNRTRWLFHRDAQLHRSVVSLGQKG